MIRKYRKYIVAIVILEVVSTAIVLAACDWPPCGKLWPC